MPSPALLVRLRPTGPWRIAPDSGRPDRIDQSLRSDTLYSALSGAMHSLGYLGDWLAATAESESPLLSLSSAFPFTNQTLFVPAPRHTWPPAAVGKVRWKAARFVPLPLVESLLRDEDVQPERWAVDPWSGCLLPVGKHGMSAPPYRVSRRSTAAVDRLTLRSDVSDVTACAEFAQGAGLWTLVGFASGVAREAWAERLRSAFRLLADTGIGGGKARGWGRSRPPQFQEVELPAFLVGTDMAPEGDQAGYWMLSLFQAGSADTVDWTRGDYSLAIRQGRTVNGGLKRPSRMVEEGSVLFASSEPAGVVEDVSPSDSPHPVFRNGLALTVRVPVKALGMKYRPALSTAAPADEAQKAEEPVVEEPSVDETPMPVPPVEEPPFETPPAGEPPVETPPSEEPVETPPIQEPDRTPPVEEPPVEEPLEPRPDDTPESEPSTTEQPRPNEQPVPEPPSTEPAPNERPSEDPAQPTRPEQTPPSPAPLTPRPDETPEAEPPVRQPEVPATPVYEPPSTMPSPIETPSSEPPQTIPGSGSDYPRGGEM